MATKILIATGIIWLAVVCVSLFVSTAFTITLKPGAWVRALVLLGTLRILFVVFWIGWTLPLAAGAYRLVKGY